MTSSEQARADAETLRLTLERLRNNYLAAIEHTLRSVPIPSGQPAISRVFADIYSLIKHATSEIDVAFRAIHALRKP